MVTRITFLICLQFALISIRNPTANPLIVSRGDVCETFTHGFFHLLFIHGHTTNPIMYVKAAWVIILRVM